MRCLWIILLLASLLAPAAAQEGGGASGLCTARFQHGDVLALEPRLVGLLAGDGCAPGDLLHFTFEEEALAAAAAARHCRFDRPVLLARGAQTHLVCVWQGAIRRPRS